MSFRAHRRSGLVGVVAVVAGLCLPLGAWAAGPEQWAARYDGVGNSQEHNDEATSIATSPDGSKVFVTGTSDGPFTLQPDYATVAYDAGTGAQLWAKRYGGASYGTDEASSITAAGSSVFVTGSSDQTGPFGYYTIAYDASTGTKLWAKRYDSAAGVDAVAHAIVATPGGGTVFVTGESRSGPLPDQADYATVAYDGATGAKLWERIYDGPPSNADVAVAASASPDGSAVFVTGRSKGNGDFDYATVAYNADNGKRLWAHRYDGPPGKSDEAVAIASSADGDRVVVTGRSVSETTGPDYVTVAYDAATGVQQWVARYTGKNKAADRASSIAISGDSATVFVTGERAGGPTGLNYGTVAYDASSGGKLWAKTYNGSGDGPDHAFGVVAAGDHAVVTGQTPTATFSLSYTTIAYDAATGSPSWTYAYEGPDDGGDAARGIAASADGTHVFVTGTSASATTGEDYATVAYAI